MPKIIQHKLLPGLLLILTLPGWSAGAEHLSGSAVPVDQAKVAVTSFTLEQAVDYALAHNPDMQIAVERISHAEAQLGIALSAFYPQVTARASYENSNNPANVFAMIVSQRSFDTNSMRDINNPGYRQNFRPEVIGRLSLFRGGRDYHSSKAAESGISAAESERSAVRNALIEAVTTSYYAYLAGLELQKVSRDSILAITSQLSQTKSRYEAGTALKSDMLSLEVKLAEAQDAGIRASNSIELSKAGLAYLLGIPGNQHFDIVPSASMRVKPDMPSSVESLFDLAIAERPEMKAISNQVRVREYQVKIEQGGYLPDVNAFVSYGQNSQHPGFYGQRDNVTVGVAVEMNLFSGFDTRQRVNAAERKLAEVRETERKTKLGIEQEVRTAFLKLGEALARLHVTEASVRAADEALRLVNEERRAGMATVTRYIESEVARNKARFNAIAAHYDALNAEAVLKKATGNWK